MTTNIEPINQEDMTAFVALAFKQKKLQCPMPLQLYTEVGTSFYVMSFASLMPILSYRESEVQVLGTLEDLCGIYGLEFEGYHKSGTDYQKIDFKSAEQWLVKRHDIFVEVKLVFDILVSLNILHR